jgi:hypothetical protein
MRGMCVPPAGTTSTRRTATTMSVFAVSEPVKRDVIEDELAALGMRLKVLHADRKNLLAEAYQTGRITGENLEWEDKIAAA